MIRRDIDFTECIVTVPGYSGWSIGDVKHPEEVHEMNTELRMAGGTQVIVA